MKMKSHLEQICTRIVNLGLYALYSVNVSIENCTGSGEHVEVDWSMNTNLILLGTI